MRKSLFYGTALICGTLVGAVLVITARDYFRQHNNTTVMDVYRAANMFAGGETLNFCADGQPSAKGISFSFTNIKSGKPVGQILKSSREATEYCVQYSSPNRPQVVFVQAIGGKNAIAYGLPILAQPPRP